MSTDKWNQVFLRETKKSISVIPIFRNGTSILLDDLFFHVDKICNFIFVLDTNLISVQGDRFRDIQVSDTRRVISWPSLLIQAMTKSKRSGQRLLIIFSVYEWQFDLGRLLSRAADDERFSNWMFDWYAGWSSSFAWRFCSKSGIRKKMKFHEIHVMLRDNTVRDWL